MIDREIVRRVVLANQAFTKYETNRRLTTFFVVVGIIFGFIALTTLITFNTLNIVFIYSNQEPFTNTTTYDDIGISKLLSKIDNHKNYSKKMLSTGVSTTICTLICWALWYYYENKEKYYKSIYDKYVIINDK